MCCQETGRHLPWQFVAKLSSPCSMYNNYSHSLVHHWMLVLINLVCHLSTTNFWSKHCTHTHTLCTATNIRKKNDINNSHQITTRDITALMSCHLGGNRLWSATKKLTKQTFLHLSRSQLLTVGNMFHQNPTRILLRNSVFFLGTSHGKSQNIGWFGVIQSIYELTKTSAWVFKL